MSHLSLGVTLPQFTADPARFADGVRRAEAAGLDSAWVFDHLWPLGGDRLRPVLEGWTALAYAASLTRRLRVGTLVTRSSLRHPVLLAKMAATVARAAPGRLVVGLGSGDEMSRAENEAFGLPFFAGAERIPQLVSALEVVTAYLGEPVVSHSDGFVQVVDLPTGSSGAPPPALWVGGWHQDALHLAGEGADGWNAWGSTPERYGRAGRTVRSIAQGRGLELSWGGQVLLGATDAEAEAKLKNRDPSMFIVGGPDTVARRLGSFVGAGAEHLIVALPDAGDPGGYELLAQEVRPRLSDQYPLGV
ncbi:MAG: LLM class flavin-dependent oxidoreductase [Actinomycetota bacterium]